MAVRLIEQIVRAGRSRGAALFLAGEAPAAVPTASSDTKRRPSGLKHPQTAALFWKERAFWARLFFAPEAVMIVHSYGQGYRLAESLTNKHPSLCSRMRDVMEA